eukprot:EG_transcript_65449
MLLHALPPFSGFLEICGTRGGHFARLLVSPRLLTSKEESFPGGGCACILSLSAQTLWNILPHCPCFSCLATLMMFWEVKEDSPTCLWGLQGSLLRGPLYL